MKLCTATVEIVCDVKDCKARQACVRNTIPAAEFALHERGWSFRPGYEHQHICPKHMKVYRETPDQLEFEPPGLRKAIA